MGGKPKFPEIPRPQDPEVAAEKARERERQRLLKAKGRASTLLTGGLGDLSTPTLGRAVLTGE